MTADSSGAWPDLDTLADFHAGVLDPQTAARVAEHVRTDPAAQQVLAALDATVADLRALPAVTMPPQYVRRLDAAIAQEAGRGPRPVPLAPAARPAAPPPLAPVSDLDRARERRDRRNRLLASVAAGIVVLGGAAYATVSLSNGPDANTAAPTSQSAPAGSSAPDYDDSTLDAGDVLSIGRIDKGGQVDSSVAGKMATAFERNKCLLQLRGAVTRAGKPPQGAAPLAVQQITFKGQPAYAFVFPADDGKVRLVVVAVDSCGTVLKDVVTTP